MTASVRWQRVHLAASVVAVAALTWIGRDQWFIRDDWIITRGAGWHLFDALTQHMAFVTSAVFQSLHPIFGLHHYLPYLFVAILAHVAAVHLVTVVALRCGVPGPAASAVGVLPLVSPMATDHVLHAVNVGFGTAVAFPLAALLLADPQPLERVPASVSPRRLVATGALLLLGVASTSLGLVLSLLVAGWLTLRLGWKQGLWLSLPVPSAYLLWVALAGDTRGPGAPIGTLVQTWFFIRSLATSTSTALTRLPAPWALSVVGVVIVAGLWSLARRDRPEAEMAAGTLGRVAARLTPAGLLGLTSLVMLAVVGLQRGTSPTLIAAPRYQHMLLILLIPLLAAGVAALGNTVTARLPARVGPVLAGVSVLAMLVLLLPAHARALNEVALAQAASEHSLRGRLAAAAVLLDHGADGVGAIDLDARVDRGSIPQFSFADLVRVVDSGAFRPEDIEYTDADFLAAEVAASFHLADSEEAVRPVVLVGVWGPPAPLADGCVEVERENTLVLRVDEAGTIPVRPVGEYLKLTVRIGVQDETSGTRSSTSWAVGIDRPRTLVVPRPGTILFLQPGFTGRVEVCGLLERG